MPSSSNPAAVNAMFLIISSSCSLKMFRTFDTTIAVVLFQCNNCVEDNSLVFAGSSFVITWKMPALFLGPALLFAFLFLVALYESWIIPVPVAQRALPPCSSNAVHSKGGRLST